MSYEDNKRGHDFIHRKRTDAIHVEDVEPSRSLTMAFGWCRAGQDVTQAAREGTNDKPGGGEPELTAGQPIPIVQYSIQCAS
jgi:hypothetical protein